MTKRDIRKALQSRGDFDHAEEPVAPQVAASSGRSSPIPAPAALRKPGSALGCC